MKKTIVLGCAILFATIATQASAQRPENADTRHGRQEARNDRRTNEYYRDADGRVFEEHGERGFGDRDRRREGCEHGRKCGWRERRHEEREHDRDRDRRDRDDYGRRGEGRHHGN